MEIGWEILAPILGIAGIWLGSFLQKNQEREKDRQDRRLRAYATFLEIWAVTERWDSMHVMDRMFSGAALTDHEANYISNIKERMDHAHANLMIYGSENVISALSRLYSNLDPGLTDSKKQAYFDLLSAMRGDGFSNQYAGFENDMDNIMLSGPLARRQLLYQQKTTERGTRKK